MVRNKMHEHFKLWNIICYLSLTQVLIGGNTNLTWNITNKNMSEHLLRGQPRNTSIHFSIGGNGNFTGNLTNHNGSNQEQWQDKNNSSNSCLFRGNTDSYGNLTKFNNSTDCENSEQEQMKPTCEGEDEDDEQRVQIAGLFSKHFNNDRNCSTVLNPTIVQMEKAMILAIQYINSNMTTLLPTVHLDYVINDTCSIVGNSVKASLGYSFVTKYFEDNETCERHEIAREKLKVKTVAIIGPGSSEEARAVAEFAGLFNVPVVSPTATSTLLSDPDRFPYFFRTVPSDKYQIKAISDLLAHFKWNLVILLVSDDEYGRSARLNFNEEQKYSEYPICTEVEEVINQNNFADVHKKVSQTKYARVIVLISKTSEANGFIKYAAEANTLRDFTWIASDAWNMNDAIISNREFLLKGMIGISPYEVETPTIVDLNARFNKIYESVSTINSVLAVAKAMHKMLDCNETLCKKKIQCTDWSEFASYIRDIELTDLANNTISLNECKDTHIQYNFWNLQESATGKYEYIHIGRWYTINKNNGSIDINGTVQWHTGFSMVPPNSTCSETCWKGQHKIAHELYDRCCWICSGCKGNTYSNSKNQEQCDTCPENYTATPDKTGCKKLREIYLKLTDKPVVILLTFSAIGILLLLLTLVVSFCYWNSPVIKASRRGLLHVTILGTAVLFLLPLTNIEKLTTSRCKAFPLIFGIAVVLNIGVLLIKTNRIARIFFSNKITNKKVRCSSLSGQYFMIGFLVSMEIGICAIWEFVLVSPQMKFLKYNGSRIATCTFGKPLLGLVIWTMYNAGLIILCTYQSFTVRKVPTNYNEAKYIAFTVMTTCICIVAYVPVYLGTTGYYRDLVGSFLYIFAGTVEFCCLLGPKFYIVLLRPDKNKSIRDSLHRQSPHSSKKQSRYFESDSYFPTEHELDLLQIDINKSTYCKEQKIEKPRRHLSLGPASASVSDDVSYVLSTDLIL